MNNEFYIIRILKTPTIFELFYIMSSVQKGKNLCNLLEYVVMLVWRTCSYIFFIMATVPPRWIVEPTDKAFALGSDARLECKADGFPRPSLGWKKAAGM